MWQLNMTNAAGDWIEAGRFDSVTAAAGGIRELEGYPVTGIFLLVHVDTANGTDAEALGHLEHTGRKARYVVKRLAPT